MFVNTELLEAMQVVTGDAVCHRIFDFLIREGGRASGWAVAKTLGMVPELVGQGLDRLTQARVVQGNGAGVDGFYFLTDLGFQLRSQLGGA